MENLTTILKGGEITPYTMAGADVLHSERGIDFVKTITDKSGLLKNLKIVRTHKLDKILDVHYLADRVLHRVKEGSKPSDYTSISVEPVQLRNLRVDLDTKILRSTLEDNLDNPNFEKEIFEEFAEGFSNNLADLALNGTEEQTQSSSRLNGYQTFLKLNKGFLKILNDHADSIKLTSKTSVLDSLKEVAKAIPSEIFSEAVILINPQDLTALQDEVGNKNSGLAILLNGGAKNILGVPLVATDYMPRNTYIATSMKNLIFSYGSDIEIKRWYDNDEESLKYRFSLYCDFAVAVPKWCVISNGEDSAGGTTTNP
ncbi:MAG: phage major capsid protein [Campylobacter sp.]|nr:phage major capsid protein [Campylobacter sp.]MBQ9876737.1 phage major capsid protein [Campylobacter sp.]